MHEWALAEAVVRHLAEELGCRSVRRLKLGLGELQAIDREAFTMGLEAYSKQLNLPIEELEVVEVPARFRCRRCGREWTLAEANLPDDVREAIHFLPEAVHAYLTCPSCGSRDYEVVEGRGIVILEVEGECEKLTEGEEG